MIALIWAVGIAAGLLLYLGSKLGFFLDDWEFLVYRPGFTEHTILSPHGENIVVGPILVYKGLLATLGMSSAFPFHAIATLAFLISCVLLFVLLRERVGDLPALCCTIVLLFFGNAAEDLLWAFQIGYFVSMAAGLGMLLALQRESDRADLLATILLTVSVLFSSLGLPFLLAALIEVVTRSDRLRRVYVVVIPAAVFAVWWLGWGRTAESSISVHNVLKTPAFIFEGIAWSVGSLLGITLHRLNFGMTVLAVPATILIVLAVWRIWQLRGGSRWLWVEIAALVGFWGLAGLNQMEGREPGASRYQYVGAIFVLLVAAELLRGVRIPKLATAALVVVAGFSLTVNTYMLLHSYDTSYHPTTQIEKADLAALEITRETVEPGFVLSEEVADTSFVHIEAWAYFLARDEYGSAAYSQGELARAPQEARYAADKVMFAALRIAISEIPGADFPANASAAVGSTVAVPAQGCVSIPGDGSAHAISMPSGGVALKAGAKPATGLEMWRFSSPGAESAIEFSEPVEPGTGLEIPVPPDLSDTPWKLRFESQATTVACGLKGLNS